jgi:hypothetical protein
MSKLLIYSKAFDQSTTALSLDDGYQSLVLFLGSILGELPVQNTVRVDIGDNLTGAEGVDQRLQEKALVKVVLVSEVGDDSIGGLLGVVEGDLGEQVVNNVVVNDLVEEVTTDEAKPAVNGGEGTLDEGPCLRIIVGHRRVGVVQVSNSN